MLCLNIRQTYPRIGLRTQLSSVETKNKEAELHTTYQAPSAGIWPKAAEVEIDQYPSRHALGYSNSRDLGEQAAKDGFEGVKKGIDRRMQEANEMLNNGTKQNVFASIEKRKLVPRDRILVVQDVPPPTITVKPSQMQGNIDTGKDEVTIQPRDAEVRYNPGTFEVYMEEKGSIRMWTTEGRCDIYA